MKREPEFREVKVRTVYDDPSGHHAGKDREQLSSLREYVSPETNPQRQETKVARQYRQKFEGISQGLNARQRRKLSRKAHQALKKHRSPP